MKKAILLLLAAFMMTSANGAKAPMAPSKDADAEEYYIGKWVPFHFSFPRDNTWEII